MVDWFVGEVFFVLVFVISLVMVLVIVFMFWINWFLFVGYVDDFEIFGFVIVLM